MHPTLSRMRKGLELRETPFLAAFEDYCSAMGTNVRALEWSHKYRDGFYDGARFLHTARDGTPALVRQPVHDLVTRILPAGGARANARAAFGQLTELADRCADGVAVGYADRDGGAGPVSELKLYFSTTDVASVLPFARSAAPGGGQPPAGTWRVMTALSLQEDGRVAARVYYLWRRGDLGEAWRSWSGRWCTPSERQLVHASTSATVCVSFKEGQRDMLYLSSPLGVPQLENLVSRLLGHTNAPSPLLPHLRWLGFSKRQEALASQEVNLYFPAG